MCSDDTENYVADKKQGRKVIMMEGEKYKLTLDRPATYEIKVPGQLDESWENWGWKMKVIVECVEDNPPMTILTGTFDQAALQGLLRQLYSLGLPLISVTWIELS